MNETMLKTLELLRKESNEKLVEAARLVRLADKYPDLTPTIKGRSPKVYYCSASINSTATGLDLHHSCGCCPDSILNARVFVETVDGKVYGNPLSIAVGELHYMGGDRPHTGWRDKLKAVGISDAMIERVAKYFQKCQEDRIKAAEESLEEVSDEDPEPLI